MDHLIILDTETPSMEAKDGVVEVAWIEIDDDLKVLDEVQSLIKPYGRISAAAAGVHGITHDMVEDKPTLDEFMVNVKGNPFKTKKVLVIGHNIAFDTKYFPDYFGEIVPMCTLKLARRIYPDAENHKLQTLMYELNLKPKGKHNALDDVYTCYELLEHMMDVTGLDLEGLYELSLKPVPITKMPFGKHRGTKLVDLPKDYIFWLKNKCDNLDPDLRVALNSL